MKIIVVSGINLFTGGTLKVLQDCLASLSSFAGNKYRIIALVHQETLFPKYENVEYISFPKSRQSWIYRLYYEYFRFRKLSKHFKPYCWISMHDTTPNVLAEKKIVYCHNPFPFYNSGLRGLWLQHRIFLFSLFSRHIIYKTNIRKNNFVIVQQEWIREAFKQMFSIDNVLVALPKSSASLTETKETELPLNERKMHGGKTVFFYPAGPMIHKNFETVCQAALSLEKEGVENFEVILTTDGTENKYTNYLYQKYNHLKNLRFVGFLKRDEINRYYQDCDCLVFPSKVETWGLPITEAKEYDKPILISNLPYAKETVGKYDKVKFFDPDDANQLAKIMKDYITEHITYDPTHEIQYNNPFAKNWEELWKIVI